MRRLLKAYIHRANLDERKNSDKRNEPFSLWQRRKNKGSVLSVHRCLLLFLLSCFSCVSILQHWSAHTPGKKLLTPANYSVKMQGHHTISLFYPWRLSFEEFLLYTCCSFLIFSYPQISVKMESFLQFHLPALLTVFHTICGYHML